MSFPSPEQSAQERGQPARTHRLLTKELLSNGSRHFTTCTWSECRARGNLPLIHSERHAKTFWAGHAARSDIKSHCSYSTNSHRCGEPGDVRVGGSCAQTQAPGFATFNLSTKRQRIIHVSFANTCAGQCPATRAPLILVSVSHWGVKRVQITNITQIGRPRVAGRTS